MIKNKMKLVAVSALALKAAAINPAFAQVLISCPQNLRFGNIATCANGSYTVTAKGATSTNGGCALVTVKALPASCIISTGGVPPSKNVKVQFSANFINMTNGGSNARVDNFHMFYTGTTSTQKTLKLTPTEVSNTVTIDVGAILDFNGSQPLGAYIGSIQISVN